ncbi:312_t:CDS:1, partial [Scutellospora calospora]
MNYQASQALIERTSGFSKKNLEEGEMQLSENVQLEFGGSKAGKLYEGPNETK